MSVTKTFAGSTFNLPQNKEPKSSNWGLEVSNFLIKVADFAIPKTGGNNYLTAADLDFGATYGVILPYLKSSTTPISTTGFLRLAKSDSFAWRNNGDTGNVSLTLSASDRLQFTGSNLLIATDATSANTASKVVQRDASGDFSANIITAAGFSGPITGNASTASKWLNARTITLGTDLTGSVSIDGSADVTLNATIAANSVALGTDTTGNYIATIAGTTNQVSVSGSGSETAAVTLSLPQDIATTNSPTFASVTVTASPSASSDLANKGYVDTVAQGLDVKQSVKAGTTTAGGNITLSGTQTVDGVALSVGDRCLVKNQTSQPTNGIYVVAASTWTRATDMDLWTEVPGAFCFVEQGTTNQDTGWVCTSDQGGTLGSTAIVFSQFSGVGAYQPLDATLTGLAGYNTNGFLVQTAADTFAGRSLTASTGISITNSDGVSGNPSIAIDSTVATLTGSQTLTNKTLDAAIIDNSALMLHETSVSTPASGRIALYPKSDNKLYIKDSTGVETAVGTGSGGGVINYILNPDAESNTTGWATYADAAGTTPVDGTGGSASVTWTRNTTTPLRGNADFAFAKDAANRQGQGVSYDFTISSVDKGRKLSVSFDYNSNTTNYTASDMVVYVYDVTNSVLITPSSTSLPKNTGTLTISFDSTTSTSYRLILHVSTTNATAYTLYFDNFQVGPGQIVQGAAISEWVSYTPTTQGFGTPTLYDSYYRRVGSNMEIQARFQCGTTTATEARFYLPTGFTIGLLTLSQVVGTYIRNNANATSVKTFNAVATTANTYLTVTLSDYTTAAGPLANANGSNWSNGEVLMLRASIPIAEWSGSGTVNLGPGANVEYAYPTGTWDSSTTAYAYGPQGAQMGALTAARTKDVTWQYPLQTDDVITLEGSTDRVNWFPLIGGRLGAALAGVVTSNDSAGNLGGGALWHHTSSTTTRVTFAAKANMANDDAPTTDWPSDAYFRIRKAKASAPVGFGLVTANDSGLLRSYTAMTKIRLNTGNGFGSTNTVIRRFTTTVVNTGTGITYADSASAGASFTVNEAGIYAISYSDGFSGAAAFGISLNSSQLTTSIASITAADRLCLALTAAADYHANVSITLSLSIGDIIRPHASGSESSAPARSQFTIQRVG
jgi:hypothetical protein